MNKYREFENYLKEMPSKDGYFGEFGGAYLPPELVPAFKEADDAYEAICHSAQFINELRRIGRNSKEDLLPFTTAKDYPDSSATVRYILRERTLTTPAHTSLTTVWARDFSQSIWERRSLSQRRARVSTVLQ